MIQSADTYRTDAGADSERELSRRRAGKRERESKETCCSIAADKPDGQVFGMNEGSRLESFVLFCAIQQGDEVVCVYVLSIIQLCIWNNGWLCMTND